MMTSSRSAARPPRWTSSAGASSTASRRSLRCSARAEHRSERRDAVDDAPAELVHRGGLAADRELVIILTVVVLPARARHLAVVLPRRGVGPPVAAGDAVEEDVVLELVRLDEI